MLQPIDILKSKFEYTTLNKDKNEFIEEVREVKNHENLNNKERLSEDKLSLFTIIIFALPSFGKMSSLLLLK